MKRSVVIVAMALMIIGMRATCAAQFSQRASIQESDTQMRNEVHRAISISKSSSFVFRVRKYLHVSPAHQDISRKGAKAQSATAFLNGFLCDFATLREKYSLPSEVPR